MEPVKLAKYIVSPNQRSPSLQRNNLRLDLIFGKKGIKPESERSLLNHLDFFAYATLFPRKETYQNNSNQEVFYVVKGSGEIFFQHCFGEIKSGYAFIIPPNIEYTIKNKSGKQLEMLVISEEPPKSQSDEIIIRNTAEIQFDKFDSPLHWCHRSQTIFSYERDNLSKIHYVSLVHIPPKQLPEPHKHFPGHDEVWHALQGKTEMAFKNYRFSQAPGTSILIPDHAKTEHTSITGDKEAIFFFFMHHMALDNRILVLGSNGRIGRILVNYLKNERGYQFLAGIDRDHSPHEMQDSLYCTDILYEDFDKHLRDVDTVIHLAANPNPFIDETEANKNIMITKKLIGACKRHKPKRIIYASSINVYPYRDIERITAETPLSANTTFNLEGHYGKSKIECEKMLKQYCSQNNIYLLNLRLGWVTSNDKHPPYFDSAPHQRDLEVALKHEDLFNIIDKAIKYNGIDSYVCVSGQCKFIDDNIRFQI